MLHCETEQKMPFFLADTDPHYRVTGGSQSPCSLQLPHAPIGQVYLCRAPPAHAWVVGLHVGEWVVQWLGGKQVIAQEGGSMLNFGTSSLFWIISTAPWFFSLFPVSLLANHPMHHSKNDFSKMQILFYLFKTLHRWCFPAWREILWKLLEIYPRVLSLCPLLYYSQREAVMCSG